MTAPRIPADALPRADRVSAHSAPPSPIPAGRKPDVTGGLLFQ